MPFHFQNCYILRIKNIFYSFHVFAEPEMTVIARLIRAEAYMALRQYPTALEDAEFCCREEVLQSRSAEVGHWLILNNMLYYTTEVLVMKLFFMLSLFYDFIMEAHTQLWLSYLPTWVLSGQPIERTPDREHNICRATGL